MCTHIEPQNETAPLIKSDNSRTNGSTRATYTKQKYLQTWETEEQQQKNEQNSTQHQQEPKYPSLPSSNHSSEYMDRNQIYKTVYLIRWTQSDFQVKETGRGRRLS